jgi:hypothetical protein
MVYWPCSAVTSRGPDGRKETRVREKPESSEWYYFKAGSNADMKAGPLSWERLCSQAKAGTLEPDDVVWDPGFGWRIATQVPGLFPAATPAATTAKVVSLHPEKLPLERPPKTRGRHWRFWLGGGIALVIVAAVLGVYFGLIHGSDDTTVGGPTVTALPALTTTVVSPTTTVAAPTTTALPPTTVGAAPARLLGGSDNGHEIRLNVGERLRIELEPKRSSRVRTVEWEFTPIVLRQTDSGVEKAGDRVVKCWLELEAVTAGPVTVRVRYGYRVLSGAPWVCYLIVRD